MAIKEILYHNFTKLNNICSVFGLIFLYHLCFRRKSRTKSREPSPDLDTQLDPDLDPDLDLDLELDDLDSFSKGRIIVPPQKRYFKVLLLIMVF